MGPNDTVVTDEGTTGFLEIEDAAHNLVTRLSRLDQESNRYTTAAVSLDDAARATRDLTEAVREVGDSAARGIEVIASVGGPEIVDRLSSVEVQQAEHFSAILKKVNLAASLAGAAAALALVAMILALVK